MPSHTRLCPRAESSARRQPPTTSHRPGGRRSRAVLRSPTVRGSGIPLSKGYTGSRVSADSRSPGRAASLEVVEELGVLCGVDERP
eukprot:scaffold129837_cov49-Phaeocystis_antarctica.AAC.1